MKRMIVMLTTKSGEVYEIRKQHDPDTGFVIESIDFKRDGLSPINLGMGNAYVVTMQNPDIESNIVFKLIPYDRMDSILFIEDVEKEADETTTSMKSMKKV